MEKFQSFQVSEGVLAPITRSHCLGSPVSELACFLSVSPSFCISCVYKIKILAVFLCTYGK